MNPVVVEQQFQTLIVTLPLLMSRRTRLLKICEFLEPLIDGGQKQFVLAYAPETLQMIQKDLPQCAAEGTSDRFYTRLERLLKCLRGEAGSLLDDPAWSRLVGECAALRESASRYALRSQRPSLVEAHGKHRGKPVAPLVPFVETEPLVPELPARFASVSPLEIDAGKKQNREKDDSVFLELYADPDAVQKNTILVASKAARTLFEKLPGKKFPHALNIHCSFGQQGRSWEALPVWRRPQRSTANLFGCRMNPLRFPSCRGSR